MRYLLLIYTDEKTDLTPNDPGFGEMMTGYRQFTDEVKRNGAHLAGEPLQSVTTATTVRVRDGKTMITDGPFAETREQLGGFYMLECKNLDEATAYAAKIPGALRGSIEVRPIMELG